MQTLFGRRIIAAKDFGSITFSDDDIVHRIVRCSWTGRIERGSGVWFDLDVEAELVDTSKMISVHAHLSSTAWNERCYGFLAAPISSPLRWSKVTSDTYEFDTEDLESPVLCAFGLYRTAHQHTGNHSLTIRRQPKKPTFKIDWRAEIGDFDEPNDYFASFHAKLTGATFDGIHFAAGTTQRDAVDQMTYYVHDADKYRFCKRKDAVAMLPPATRTK